MRSTAIPVVALLLVPLGHGPSTADAQTVEAPSLELIEGRGGLDAETGFVRIAGEVRNKSKHWIRSVRISVRLFDASGTPISVTSIPTAMAGERGEANPADGVYSDRDLVPPGESAPFEYTRDATKLGGAVYASHKLSVAARQATGAPSVIVDGFDPKKGTDGWYSVTGRIKNVGKIDCRSPEAVIGIYGKDGKMVRVLSEAPDSTFQKILPPGGAVAFKIRSIENSGGNTIGKMKAWGDCSPQD
jgi:hypothetical protein